jgi:hypothetical protein
MERTYIYLNMRRLYLLFLLDNCPWGNQKGVAIYGMTCDEFKQPENHWRCYDDFIAKICCDACNSVKRNVQGKWEDVKVCRT